LYVVLYRWFCYWLQDQDQDPRTTSLATAAAAAGGGGGGGLSVVVIYKAGAMELAASTIATAACQPRAY